jgi:predicted component of type VI protein secretion system
MPIRLIERIAYSEIPDGSSLRPASYEGKVKYSILFYLDGLLNTRRGEVYIDKNYGLPSMANIASTFYAGSKADIGNAIVEQILLYEKRISNPSIREDEVDNLRAIRFILDGTINISQSGELLRNFPIEITVQPSGRVVLKEKRGL